MQDHRLFRDMFDTWACPMGARQIRENQNPPNSRNKNRQIEEPLSAFFTSFSHRQRLATDSLIYKKETFRKKNYEELSLKFFNHFEACCHTRNKIRPNLKP